MKPSFRRIRGRIVPIMNSNKGKIAMQAGTAAALGGGAAATLSKNKSTSKTPSKLFLGLGYGLQALSGIIAASPVRSISGGAKNIIGSIAADVVSTASFTKAVSGTKMSKREKLKSFAKHQAAGTALGYAVFGGALLKNPSNRAWVKNFASKAFKLVKAVK